MDELQTSDKKIQSKNTTLFSHTENLQQNLSWTSEDQL